MYEIVRNKDGRLMMAMMPSQKRAQARHETDGY